MLIYSHGTMPRPLLQIRNDSRENRTDASGTARKSLALPPGSIKPPTTDLAKDDARRSKISHIAFVSRVVRDRFVAIAVDRVLSDNGWLDDVFGRMSARTLLFRHEKAWKELHDDQCVAQTRGYEFTDQRSNLVAVCTLGYMYPFSGHRRRDRYDEDVQRGFDGHAAESMVGFGEEIEQNVEGDIILGERDQVRIEKDGNEYGENDLQSGYEMKQMRLLDGHVHAKATILGEDSAIDETTEIDRVDGRPDPVENHVEGVVLLRVVDHVRQRAHLGEHPQEEMIEETDLTRPKWNTVL